jgi:anthranilate phosphoribosyltransferase
LLKPEAAVTELVIEKSVKEMLEHILDGHHLTEEESARLLKALTDSALSPAVAGAILAGLRAKGVVAAELRGFASAMQVDSALRSRSIDIVGTGGDASGSVNISTGTSLLVAAGGVPVIKHGNRSISSRSGSADVLEALGLSLPLDEQRAGECLTKTGFTFLFAPHYHPAMKAIAPIRQALGIRTIFNVLGPLTNPATPPFQLVGAYSESMAKLMADTLAGLPGLTRAFVVHGALGWDEPTTAGPFVLFDVRPASVTRSLRSPADYGMRTCAASELAGGDATHNAAALRAVFEGRDLGAHRDTLLLGAALAFECAGLAPGPMDGVARARAIIDTGAAQQMLQRLAEFGRG